MHSWKPNHDEVPNLVQDQYTLKVKLQEWSVEFGLL